MKCPLEKCLAPTNHLSESGDCTWTNPTKSCLFLGNGSKLGAPNRRLLSKTDALGRVEFRDAHASRVGKSKSKAIKPDKIPSGVNPLDGHGSGEKGTENTGETT